MKKEIKPLIGQVEQDQIDKWKKENPDGIFRIVLNGQVGYFRDPDVQDLNAASAVTDADNPLDYFKVLANDTYLGGSRELFEGKGKMVMDFIATYRPKIEGKKGQLENL